MLKFYEGIFLFILQRQPVFMFIVNRIWYRKAWKIQIFQGLLTSVNFSTGVNCDPVYFNPEAEQERVPLFPEAAVALWTSSPAALLKARKPFTQLRGNRLVRETQLSTPRALLSHVLSCHLHPLHISDSWLLLALPSLSTEATERTLPLFHSQPVSRRTHSRRQTHSAPRSQEAPRHRA